MPTILSNLLLKGQVVKPSTDCRIGDTVWFPTRSGGDLYVEGTIVGKPTFSGDWLIQPKGGYMITRMNDELRQMNCGK